MKKKRKKKTEDENYVPKAFKKDEKKGKKGQKEKKEKKDKKKDRKLVLIIVILVTIILAIVLGNSAYKWKILAKEMVKYENSTVLDSDGNEIAKLGCTRKNTPIKIENVPKNLKNAYIAIEDERFYKHGGIDIKRTGGAIISYITHFGKSSYGGSTITQQLVKNITGDSTDSITRKVKEWWKAWILETALSKDEIITSYLNVIYTGPSIYGVENGAKYYFDEHVSNLDIAECAFLAGINHSPNSYNPFVDKDNTDKIKTRTKTVLSKMKELKYISDDEYNSAIQEVENGLKFKNGEVTAISDGVYSYHTDAMITEIANDIKNKYKISDTFASNYINMAGLTIYSTQDSNIQDETEKESTKKKYILASQNGKDTSQAAMVVMDHKTGQVLACTGGLGKKTEPRTFNRATQSVRQTGSAIKPIAVLVPGIDKKIFTASTIFDDTEQDFENSYHPVDYSKSLGNITVRRAVESSQNIPFVEMMEKIKPKTSIKYMEKMGVTTLTNKDNSLPLSLGGLEKGISPLQMAGAYSTIANDGEYIEPTFYTKINTSNGKISVTQASHSGWEMVGIINLLFKSLDNSITIYVPAGSPLISSIKINTDNSAIKSDCALNTEFLNIETSNGAIKLNNLSVSKQTQIKTSNGLISLNGNFSGDSNLKTSNGKIEVAGLIKDSFTAKTSNGSVDIDVNRPESEYSIYGKTSNGSVKVNGENHSTDYSSYSSTSNTINARTSNGAISLDFAR